MTSVGDRSRHAEQLTNGVGRFVVEVRAALDKLSDVERLRMRCCQARLGCRRISRHILFGISIMVLNNWAMASPISRNDALHQVVYVSRATLALHSGQFEFVANTLITAREQ